MPKKILVVDDEGDLTMLIRSRLEMNGFEVEECQNGGQALDKILESDYGLVLMDYFMPSLRGDEVCQSVRENEQKKDLPIIIMTSFTDKEPSFFKEQGATDVVYKPIDNEELVEKVIKYAGEG